MKTLSLLSTLTRFPALPVSQRKMMVGDKRLQLSHDQHMARAKAAFNKEQPHNVLGCKGISLVPLTLPYVDYNNIWIVPIAHALLYGVVPAFVNHALRKVKKPALARYSSSFLALCLNGRFPFLSRVKHSGRTDSSLHLPGASFTRPMSSHMRTAPS